MNLRPANESRNWKWPYSLKQITAMDRDTRRAFVRELRFRYRAWFGKSVPEGLDFLVSSLLADDIFLFQKTVYLQGATLFRHWFD